MKKAHQDIAYARKEAEDAKILAHSEAEQAIESIAKNALTELHNKKGEFIEQNIEYFDRFKTVFSCRQCAKSFKTINEMHSHALGIHKDNLSLNQEDEYYECDICERYFKEPQCQLEHTEVMYRYCAKCSKEFFNESDFRIHQENNHKCKKCQKYFKKKKYLKTHEASC